MKAEFIEDMERAGIDGVFRRLGKEKKEHESPVLKLLNIILSFSLEHTRLLCIVNKIIFSPAERWPQFLTPHRNYVTT